ncbi:MAG: magnesium chelatase subunit H, partial [Chloroflexota bacterium]
MQHAIHIAFLTMDGGHNTALHQAVRTIKDEYNVEIQLSLHSTSHLRDPHEWERLEHDLQRADFIFGGMLFGEEYVRPLERILDRLDETNPEVPKLFITSNPALIYRTKIGKLSLAQANDDEEQGVFKRWMQKLRPKKKGRAEGNRQTSFIRNLTRLMKYIPGMMRDLHTFIAAHDFWLHSSPENLSRFLCLLIDRYVPGYHGQLPVKEALQYPDLAIYHPDAPQSFDTIADYRAWRKSEGLPIANGKAGAFNGSVGLLTMRAVILSGNTDHLDALIRDIESQGIEARAAYSALMDFRPAITAFMQGGDSHDDLPRVDVLLNSMGFPLVGGPAGSQPDLAIEKLGAIDVPYFDMIPLGFQRVEDWQADDVGLNPMQVAMNIALPELDGSSEPVIYGGPTNTSEKFIALIGEQKTATQRIARRVRLRHKTNADKRVAIVLFNFPPNLGNAGTAAFLDVFQSLHRTLLEMKSAGYTLDVPETVDGLRDALIGGNAVQHGTTGNVTATLSLNDYRELFPRYTEIEEYWGYAPGELLTNGKEFYILGAQFGNIFVGMQPGFGYERDPMRLLMGSDASPHHGFAAFYTWLNHRYDADAVLHFGTHGALEFMPGKQVGVSADCWSTRLLGDLPNIYYYCVNNPSEGTIAKRRSAATLISHMVPPLQQAGLYKGLRRLKDDIDTYHTHPDERLLEDIASQAERLNITVDASTSAPERFITALGYELQQVESRMIPMGLHVLGKAPEEAELVDMLALIVAFNSAQHASSKAKLPPLPELVARGLGWKYSDLAETLATDPVSQQRWAQIDSIVRECMRLFINAPRNPKLDVTELENYLHNETSIPRGLLVNLWSWLDDLLYRIVHDEEIAGILHALDGGYIHPSPGNDVVRNEHIVPTGRNIHALDPYRIPGKLALYAAASLVDSMLERIQAEQGALPETVAMVLWGTDNLKSDGEGIAQCLELIGARPIEDELGNISSVELIPLKELGRPRIDVVMTVSGIFRDLFHNQAGLLDQAIRMAAHADEPIEKNFIRKHALEHAADLNISLGQADLLGYGIGHGK